MMQPRSLPVHGRMNYVWISINIHTYIYICLHACVLAWPCNRHSRSPPGNGRGIHVWIHAYISPSLFLSLSLPLPLSHSIHIYTYTRVLAWPCNRHSRSRPGNGRINYDDAVADTYDSTADDAAFGGDEREAQGARVFPDPRSLAQAPHRISSPCVRARVLFLYESSIKTYIYMHTYIYIYTRVRGPGREGDSRGRCLCTRGVSMAALWRATYQQLHFGLYMIFSHLFLWVQESIILYYPRPFRITHTTAILLCDSCVRYGLPLTLSLYAVHHTILVMTISCKG